MYFKNYMHFVCLKVFSYENILRPRYAMCTSLFSLYTWMRDFMDETFRQKHSTITFPCDAVTA